MEELRGSCLSGHTRIESTRFLGKEISLHDSFGTNLDWNQQVPAEQSCHSKLLLLEF